MKWRDLRLPLGALAILAVLLNGYRIGSSGQNRNRQEPGFPSSNGSLSQIGDRKFRDAPDRSSDSLTATEQLLHLCAPDRRDGLSSEEEDACWRLMKGMGAAEIRDTLAALEKQPSSSAADHTVSALYFRWAQIDPRAAAQTLMGKKSDDGDFSWSNRSNFLHLLTAWIKTDPAAALAWAGEEGNSGEALNTAKYLAAQFEIAQGLPMDPDRLFRETMGAPEAMADKMAKSREDRDAFVKSAQANLSPPQAISSVAQLLRRWVASNPEEAMREIGDSSLTQVLSPAMDGNPALFVAGQWMSDDPSACLAWMAQSGSGISLQDQVKLFDQRSRYEPERSIDLLANAQNPDLTAAAVKSAAFDALGRSAGDQSAYAVRSRFGVWQQQQPEAAEAWLGSLPESFRKILTPDQP